MQRLHNKNCEHCGKPFAKKDPRSRFCTVQCVGLHRRTNPEVFNRATGRCLYCKKLLSGKPKRQQFCNRTCMALAVRVDTPNTSCCICGKPFRLSPSVLSKRKRVHCSKRCYAKDGQQNAHQWKGGCSRGQRKKVRELYGDKCMICGWMEAPCDAHHIVPARSGGTHALSNLIVLCPNHHRLADLEKIPRNVLQRKRRLAEHKAPL